MSKEPTKFRDDSMYVKPPSMSAGQKFKRFLYNPETGAVLSRTPKLWGMLTNFLNQKLPIANSITTLYIHAIVQRKRERVSRVPRQTMSEREREKGAGLTLNFLITTCSIDRAYVCRHFCNCHFFQKRDTERQNRTLWVFLLLSWSEWERECAPGGCGSFLPGSFSSRHIYRHRPIRF